MGSRPTSEVVAVAWLAGADIPAATQLPKVQADWAADGFVTVTTVGGTSSYDVPLIRPVLQVDCWAVTPTSDKPPWWKANALAEAIRAATYDIDDAGRALTLPGAYDDARVLSAYLLGEPVRVTGDPSGFARFRFDLALAWVAE